MGFGGGAHIFSSSIKAGAVHVSVLLSSLCLGVAGRWGGGLGGGGWGRWEWGGAWGGCAGCRFLKVARGPYPPAFWGCKEGKREVPTRRQRVGGFQKALNPKP